MSKERLAPCIYYICKGQCSKGKEAEQTEEKYFGDFRYKEEEDYE